MARFTISLALLCIVGGAFSSSVPVLLWGSGGSLRLPALSSNPQPILDAVQSSRLTLAFVEEKLSPEDISGCKTANQKSCFKYLASLSSKSYAVVEGLVDGISGNGENVKSLNVDENGNLDAEIPLEQSSVVVVSLKDNSELSHKANLAKHDAIMQKIYNDVASKVGNDNVLALYTAKLAGGLKRTARQAPPTPTAAASSTTPAAKPAATSAATPAATSATKAAAAAAATSAPTKVPIIVKQAATDSVFTLMTPQLLMYYTSLSYNDNSNIVSLQITESAVTITKNNDTSFNVTMPTNLQTIEFMVSIGVYGYWSVIDLTYGNAATTTNRTVEAAYGFSYYCGPQTTYVLSTGESLTWLNLQLQPTFGNGTATMTQFGDPYNCVGFTSIPIWSGLFVTVIFLFIMSIGITWLMDINTMDRFDDPKGKTITISTTD